MDSRSLRNMLGQFATGVTVVTAPHGDDYACLTVNSFSSVSLDPPLVLFNLHRSSAWLQCFEQATRIGINVLDEGNREASLLFAGRDRHRWKETNVSANGNGTLFMNGALAKMECERWAIHDGGDHLIFVCKVVSFEVDGSRRPLLYFRGRFCDIGEVTA